LFHLNRRSDASSCTCPPAVCVSSFCYYMCVLGQAQRKRFERPQKLWPRGRARAHLPHVRESVWHCFCNVPPILYDVCDTHRSGPAYTRFAVHQHRLPSAQATADEVSSRIEPLGGVGIALVLQFDVEVRKDAGERWLTVHARALLVPL